MGPTPVEYRTARGRMALYALGALVLVAIGVAVVRDPAATPWTRLWGTLCIGFFGLGLVVFLIEIVRPGMGLRLDAEGIHSRHILGRRIFDLPWPELADVRVVTINRQPVVAFDAHDPEWGMADAKPAARTIRRANLGLVGSWMTVAPKLFGVKSETLVAEIDRYRRLVCSEAPVEYPRPFES